MRKLFGILLVLVFVHLFVIFPVSADPRMEINDNFCHFILDPCETDNEIFIANCRAEITTIVPPPAAKEGQVMCENYIASGYGQVVKMLPAEAIKVKPGETLRFTNQDSETPCTMVESNGRAYTSYNWESTVKVENGKPKGFVKVTYRLLCRDGHQ
jgi:plastocyanin